MKKVLLLLAISAFVNAMKQDVVQYKVESLDRFMGEINAQKLQSDPTTKLLMELCCKYSFAHRSRYKIGPFSEKNKNDIIPLLTLWAGSKDAIEVVGRMSMRETFSDTLPKIKEIIDLQYDDCSKLVPSKDVDSRQEGAGERSSRMLLIICKNYEQLVKERPGLWNSIFVGDENCFINELEEISCPDQAHKLKQAADELNAAIEKFKAGQRGLGFSNKYTIEVVREFQRNSGLLGEHYGQYKNPFKN